MRIGLAVRCASRQNSNYRDRSHSHRAARSPWAGGRAGFRARGTATLELERDALAEEMAAHLLAQFNLRKVAVEVRKFVLPDANYVSVTAIRENEITPL